MKKDDLAIILKQIKFNDKIIYRLIFNRGDKMNTLNPEMLNALDIALDEISANKKTLALIIESTGSSFMAGGDITHFAKLVQQPKNKRLELIKPMLDQAQGVVLKLAMLTVPIISIVQGAAAGYGLSLVALSDYVIALEGAKFLSAYLAIGLTPDGGALYTLKEILGVKKAKALMLFNEALTAKKAKDYGLVDYVASDYYSVESKIEQLLKQVMSLSFDALIEVKRNLIDLDAFKRNLEIEKKLFLAQVQTDEFALRIDAFLKKSTKAKVNI